MACRLADTDAAEVCITGDCETGDGVDAFVGEPDGAGGVDLRGYPDAGDEAGLMGYSDDDDARMGVMGVLDASMAGVEMGLLCAGFAGAAGILFTGAVVAGMLDVLSSLSLLIGTVGRRVGLYSFCGTGLTTRVTVSTAVLAACGFVIVSVVGLGPQVLQTVIVVVQPAGTAGVVEPGQTVVLYVAVMVVRPVGQMST